MFFSVYHIRINTGAKPTIRTLYNLKEIIVLVLSAREME